MTEDLNAFLADWGEDGTIDGHPVRLIFANPSGVEALGTPGIVAPYPRVLIPNAMMPARGASDPVLELPARQLAGITWRYLVRESLPDGTTLEGGFASVELEQHPSQS